MPTLTLLHVFPIFKMHFRGGKARIQSTENKYKAGYKLHFLFAYFVFTIINIIIHVLWLLPNPKLLTTAVYFLLWDPHLHRQQKSPQNTREVSNTRFKTFYIQFILQIPRLL